MRLACSTTSFPAESTSRAITRAAWAGFRAVEIPFGEELTNAEGEAALRQRLSGDELELAAFSAGELGAMDMAAALAAAGTIGRAALLANRMDARQVVVTAPESGTIEHLGAGLTSLLNVIAAVPVRVCIANRAGTLVATVGDLAELRRRVPGDGLGLTLDPGEAVRAGWDPAELERLPELPTYVYLDDAAGGALAPPGMGEVDWPGLASALRGANYGGYVTLRLAGADPWAVEPAAKEARSLAQDWLGLDGLET
jgi:sugar phosphate isomerase/epimerase